MKALRAQMKRLGWSETRTMNALCEWGVISDLCVTLDDIAETDAVKAAQLMELLK
jgi:hypothetical protein